MWKDYSIGYIKNNRASGISIMTAAFISALFLSFLCSLFYNFWKDDIAGICLEEGDWQGRITGTIREESIAEIRSFPGVENVVINTTLSTEQELTLDLYFEPIRKIKTVLPQITKELGLEESAAEYHYQLLSMYFVRIQGDPMPRLLMPTYLFIVILVCFSLILVIHHSFAVSMNSRIHQFGIFKSVGATPKQIRLCLIQEAAILAGVPVLAGIFLGIGLSYGTVSVMNRMTADMAGGREAVFSYHPMLFLLTLFIVAFTLLFSVWIPARKLSRLTPLEAIRSTEELELRRKKNSKILSAVFGVEGELAGNALKAQKKALRTSTLSLLLAFLGFTLMQCMFTLSSISTEHTYFEKYQDVWDVMASVKDTKIQDFKWSKEMHRLPEVSDAAVYQKAEAVCVISAKDISKELIKLGGIEAVAGNAVEKKEGEYQIKALIVILDDDSFLAYCKQIGAKERLDGAILLNRIWDSLHSHFRNREYIPYVNEARQMSMLQNTKREERNAQIPVLAYTEKVPVLREEYDDYALVHILPASLWKKIEPKIGGLEKDTYIRLLAEEREELSALDDLEELLQEKIGREYEIESENRIFEKINNDKVIRGYKLVLGAFCILLAIIGIANVFSNTLGFLRQRKKEFARYMSVGLTPFGMKKMFCIESAVLVGRPFLIALGCTVLFVSVMIKASHLEPLEFMRQAPVLPIGGFVLAVFGFVALAYYLGGRQVLRCNLAEVLREE